MKIPRALKLQFLDARYRAKKVLPYARYAVARCAPDRWYDIAMRAANDEAYDSDFAERVAYYNQLDAPFHVHSATPFRRQHFSRQSGYVADLYCSLKGFETDVTVDYEFGDVREVPSRPTLVKSRPIAGNNQNAVLMKLNSVRHFHFVRDPVAFSEKRNLAVWRGSASTVALRHALIEKFSDHPLCNVARTDGARHQRRHKNYLTLSKQLAYKFIISLEGNDVATNLKWIFSSNSLAFMPQPKYETWFMEGQLIGGVHYVQLADDLSDLPEKIEYYATNETEARAIVVAANAHAMRFYTHKREARIAHQVLAKYFRYAKSER